MTDHNAPGPQGPRPGGPGWPTFPSPGSGGATGPGAGGWPGPAPYTPSPHAPSPHAPAQQAPGYPPAAPPGYPPTGSPGYAPGGPAAYGHAPGYPAAGYAPAPGYAPAGGYSPHPTPGGRRVGKVRNPFGVWCLVLLTLGIYGIYLWYKWTEEVRNYDPRTQADPSMALMGILFSSCTLGITGIIVMVKTGERIGQAQRSAGMTDTCSGGIGLLLGFLFGFNYVYYQSHLNKIWAMHGNQPANAPV